MPVENKSKAGSVPALWLGLVFALTSLAGAIAFDLYLEHDRTTKREQDRLTTQVRVIAENLERQLFSTNLVLEGFIGDLPELGAASGQRGMMRRLTALTDAMPGIRFLGFIDASGTLIASNMAEYVGGNFAHRDYFQAVRQHPDATRLYISPPFKAANDVYVMNVTRMVPGPRGEFAGVITASLDPEYFKTLLSSVLYAPDMWDTVSHGDGKLFLLIPEREGSQGIDLNSPDTMFSRHRLSGQQASVLTGMVLVTNDFRMMALRTVQPSTLNMDKSLVVGASRNYDQIFVSWRRNALIKILLFGLIAMVSFAGLYTYQRYRRISERQAIEAAANLRLSAERLQLATEASGVGVWDYQLVAGKLVWDDSMYALYGVPQTTALTYDAWQDAMLPEDMPNAEAALKATLEKGAPYDLNFRIRRGDGVVRIIHARARVHCDAAGKPVRMVGTNEDITERKELQDKLEQQARQDYLTGLFNRRHFMEQGQVELSRVQRYGNTLSLFMIDIDHFKGINDTHGHKAGDTVLQRLGDILREALRTVDVIGRIGGEEFAVLLPETDLPSATEVAERLRERVEGTHVVLEAGSPLQFTVSIGVTALKEKNTNLDILLAQADKALYQAKESGRNRVCIAG
ncbi:sensor domain-containing diguanylate cyclase [Candidatus Ferrigenium straubiae]|jgi:diguanylate cyclase (GGDEF)-like protein/PAS domain S-box-containing protein|uniref:sensor domain-containing diguanylate cyclase n=1 Tax=Candidatus Ferrigenium straubiae TaxID=2919506 RepID=UPI003F4AE3D7